MAIKYENLNKNKQQNGWYIDITRPYNEVVKDVSKIIPDVEKNKYIINGDADHTFKEWIDHYKSLGHTLIDATPPFKEDNSSLEEPKALPNVTITAKAPAYINLDQLKREELLQNAKDALDYRNTVGKDIINPAYALHFGIGETFYDPSKNTYMSIGLKLAWDEAERKNRKFNNEVDNIIGGASVGLATTALTGGAGLLPDLIAGTIGYEAGNYLSDKITGRTVDSWINKGLGVDDSSTVGTYITPMLNPFGWATAATFKPLINAGRTAFRSIADGTALETAKAATSKLIPHAKQTLSNFSNAATKYGKKAYSYIRPFIPFTKNPYDKLLSRVNLDIIDLDNWAVVEKVKHDNELLMLNSQRDEISRYYAHPQDGEFFSLFPNPSTYTTTTSTVHIPFSGYTPADFTIMQRQKVFNDIGIQPQYIGLLSQDLNILQYPLLFSKKVMTVRTPIETTSGNLQEATRALRTELEQRIGDDGIVAGSVYKLSEGHFLGSNLMRNPNSAPHDIEIWTYSNLAADEIGRKLGMELDGTGGITRKYRNPSGDTKVEIAVIDSNPSTGKARGELAWLFFETAYPDEALKLKELYAAKGLLYYDCDLPVSAKELYDIYKKDPKLLDLRTRIDTFTAAGDKDYATGMSRKLKHYDRSEQMLMDASEKTINKNRETINHIYRQIWGTQGGEARIPSRVYNQIDFSNVPANEAFLKKLGFDDEVAKQMSLNSEQMKNVFDYWYLLKMCGKRFVKASDADTARKALSTNVSPSDMYARGVGGNQDTSPIWDWPGNYTGLVYNPLTYHPEKVKSLEDVIKLYERAGSPTTINYNKLHDESLEDYSRRIYNESLKEDLPFFVNSKDNYLGRIAKLEPSDVGSLLSIESVKVGGTFSLEEEAAKLYHRITLDDYDKIMHKLESMGVRVNAKDHFPLFGKKAIDLTTIIKDPSSNPDLYNELIRNIKGLDELTDLVNRLGMSFPEAIKTLNNKYAKEKLRLQGELKKTIRQIVNVRNISVKGQATLNKLKSKLSKLRSDYENTASLIKLLEIMGTGATLLYYGAKQKDIIDGKRQLLLLEKQRDKELKEHPEDAQQINTTYNKLRDAIIEKYELLESMKLKGTPDNTQLSTAVLNARKKYKRGGIFNIYGRK